MTESDVGNGSDTMISDKLKKRRQEIGLTQAEIAAALNIDRTTYCKYESGKSKPNIKMLQKITELFGVDYNYLLGRS